MQRRLLNGILSLFFSASVFAQNYQELKSFGDLLSRHTPDTLYVLDIDNTILRPRDFVGSDPWFNELWSLAEKSGADPFQWGNIFKSIVKEANSSTTSQIVDPSFQNFYQTVGSGSIIALSARDHDSLSDLTDKQFQEFGIHFQPEKFFPDYDVMTPLEGTSINRKSGVFLVGRKNKGVALREYVQRYGKNIRRIVFVDDLKRNAENVSAATKDLGIPVEVYRLTAADDYVKNYEKLYQGKWSFEDYLAKSVFSRSEEFAQKFPEEMRYLKNLFPNIVCNVYEHASQ